MFDDCIQLKGAISYDSRKIDVRYANYTTGYFTKKSADILGDINRDGNINAIDALQDLRHAVKEIILNDIQILAGDVNKDGDVNSLDALAILQFSTGIISSFNTTQ